MVNGIGNDNCGRAIGLNTNGSAALNHFGLKVSGDFLFCILSNFFAMIVQQISAMIVNPSILNKH